MSHLNSEALIEKASWRTGGRDFAGGMFRAALDSPVLNFKADAYKPSPVVGRFQTDFARNLALPPKLGQFGLIEAEPRSQFELLVLHHNIAQEV